MNKFESKFNYNIKDKELTAEKVWTIKGRKEIKELQKTLKTQEKNYENTVIEAKKLIKDKPEMTEDLKKLKEQLIDLQKIDVIEKQEPVLKQNEENLQAVREELLKLKNALNTKLRL